jgi:hypothetical protein
MVQTTAEARQQLLDSLATATSALGVALSALGAAYEQLDEYHADKLEEDLFRPVQLAFGRAKRTHGEFAGRYGFETRDFQPPNAGLPSTGAKGFIENAVAAISRADAELMELQDSLLPVDVGDPAMRSALAELRQIVGGSAQRAREIVRTIGR